jgi:ankyrin repeat protein
MSSILSWGVQFHDLCLVCQTPSNSVLTLIFFSLLALSTTKGNDSDLHRGPIQEQCPGTCEWIFTSRQYDEWLTQSDRPCLWLFGRGGSGKSTLLSTVASRLLTHPPERGGIVYFFVDQGHESVATARTLLRTILHAMKDRGQVSWGPKLLEVLAELEEVTVAISREKFQTLLRKILLGLKVDSQLILVLDGLEDDDSMKSVILDEVVEISSGRLNTRKVKCIISSRSSCSPALHFDACLKIDMDTESGVRQDIFIYATTQFRGLETRMTTNLEPVARALSERADCFLWARLVIEEILRARTPSLEWVQQKIVSMPSTVDSLYHQYLQTVGLNDRSHLRNLFSWLLASVRHLHLAELQHALRFDGRFSESQSRDQDTVRRGGLSSIRPLLESCAPLVEITADSKVRLVHHTFKEYLLSRRSGFTQRSNLAQEHEILARVCLQYLASNVWTERIAQVTEPLPAACLEKDDRSTIEDYAVANWLFHYQVAEAQSITLTGELQRSLEYALDAVSGHISCFDRMSPSSTMNAILRVCSGHRLRKLGKMYLDMGTDPNAGSCSYCKSPLHLAVENGHMELISILLRAGASVDLVSQADGYTPLHRAASLGHHEAVQLLLSSGARVDAVADTLGETPLHLASARGHIQVVKVLMDYDAEINSQRRLSEETPLHLAAVAGRLGVVMCLLDGRTTTKEELELYTTITQQPYYQTWSREFLTGPDWQGKYTWEADERSLAEDDVNKFLSFSKRYADVNARTREGLTALKLAVMGGHTEVAQFLLCRGAFKEVQSWDGQSVLHLAMKTGQLETVKFLLEAVIERELGTAADWHSVQQLVEKNDQDQILALLLWRAFGSEFSKTFRHPLMCSARSVGNKGMMKNARKGEEGLEFKNGTWSRGPALICAFRGLDVQGAWTSCPSFYDNS